MSVTNSYKTLKAPVQGILFKDKGSKFFGYGYAIEQEAQVREILDQLKQEHAKAQHWCFAWKLGQGNSMRYRVHDDGEPNNSAGQPIYGQILSKNLTNVLLIVVRYFGGTKLGVGGLISAYKNTAAMTLDNAIIVEKAHLATLQVDFKYEHINKVMRIVKVHNLRIKSQKMSLACQFEIEVKNEQLDEVLQLFAGLQSIKVLRI